MGKHSKFSSSTKWRLRENVLLQLMECLTPTVGSDILIDNYFTSFCLLNHFGVNNIRATCALDKDRKNDNKTNYIFILNKGLT